MLGHVSDNMEKYEFALVGNELYGFVWDDFCSQYIEMCKASLNSEDENVKKAAQSTLYYVLNAIVRLLHPFMPFVTEEIYLTMPHRYESICLETWPKQPENLPACDLASMDRLVSVINRIREVKNTAGLKPSAHLDVMIKDLDGNILKPDPEKAAMLERMAKAAWVDSLSGDQSMETVANGTLWIPSAELLDKEAEIAKLKAEQERLNKELARSHGILGNKGFLAKAPAAKVESEKKKLADYEKQLAAVNERLSALQ